MRYAPESRVGWRPVPPDKLEFEEEIQYENMHHFLCGSV